MNFYLLQIKKTLTIKENLHTCLSAPAQLVLSLFNLIYCINIYGTLLVYASLLIMLQPSVTENGVVCTEFFYSHKLFKTQSI